MLEVINQIKEAEQAADDQRKEARRQGRLLVNEAHKRGEELQQQVKAEALKLSAQKIAQVEEDGEAELAKRRKQCEEDCIVMLSEAQKRLSIAADVIVERIVKTP